MKSYSLDLRQKIIDTYVQESISQRQLAKRFRVAVSFVQKLIKQERETGNIAPKPHGGGQAPKLSAEQRMVVAELVEHHNDATLVQLCDLLEVRLGVRVSRATMGRIVVQLNLRKKTLRAMERDSKMV